MTLLTGLVATVALTLAPQSSPPSGITLSVQAWTFTRFTAAEAIEMTAQAGSKNVELFPGQVFKKGSDVKVGPEMGEEATRELRDLLSRNGLRAVAYGVTGIAKDPAQARPLFQWAKSLGIGVINTESTDALNTAEAMAKEFDMKVGIHNHPRRADDPNYRVWDPTYVLSQVKNRDRRIGACADTGHWVRSGIRPMDALKILRGRVVSCHLKDLNEFSAAGHDVPYGTGISDIPSILRFFESQKFDGPVSVEYEYNMEHSFPEVSSCIGFVRGFTTPKR